MTALGQWLRVHGYDTTASAEEAWTAALGDGIAIRVDKLPRSRRTESITIAVGYAVLLSGSGACSAAAFFEQIEPAAAWARAGRQSFSFTSLDIYTAVAIVCFDEDLGTDERALLICEGVPRSDDLCRRWAQNLDSRTSSYVGH